MLPGSIIIIKFKPLFDKIMSFHYFGIMKRMQRGECGPQASTPVQTNYPDSLSPNALNQTLITREPAWAIIKAELTEHWGWGYSDVIHARRAPTAITEEKLHQAASLHQSENRILTCGWRSFSPHLIPALLSNMCSTWWISRTTHKWHLSLISVWINVPA